MYKLHGFDKHFTCEICGNATYTGPRIFEKHFSEGRHSMGMQTLNIPNSKEYYGLTKISEVLALHKKLQEEKNKNSTWNQEEDEEFEDSEGNVMSKETYENLKRNAVWSDGRDGKGVCVCFRGKCYDTLLFNFNSK